MYAYDSNGKTLCHNVSRNQKDGLWYATVWFSLHGATNVRRYGYNTRAEAREADISDMPASFHEPPYEKDEE